MQRSTEHTERSFTDTHCHLFFDQYKDELAEIVRRAHEAGVNRIVQVGTSLSESRQAIELAEKYKGMVATVGIHPHEWETWKKSDIDELKELAKKSKTVKAVGECGLDWSRVGGSKDARIKQQELFEAQISLAGELKLCLVVHCRDAHHEVIQILERATRHVLRANPSGVIHCFTGTWEDAKRYLDLGFFISFSGIVTFKKQVEAIQEAVKKVPLDMLLLETDAPFLAPKPHRGKRNEPAYLAATAQKIADLRGVSLEEIAPATTNNAQRLFRFV